MGTKCENESNANRLFGKLESCVNSEICAGGLSLKRLSVNQLLTFYVPIEL